MLGVSSVRRPAVLMSIAIVAVYLALAMAQAGEPFIIDEMEFPRLAESVAETGRPVYYRGEQSPAHIGVFHPPLYGYTLGGWIAVFGFSPTAIRLFGVLMMIGTGLVGVRIVTLLGLAGEWGASIFLGLFLLHPFVIQSALLPDIDGTVLLLATVVLFHEVIRAAVHHESTMSAARRIGLAIAFALATKLTAVIVVPFVFVGLLLARGLKWALAVTGLSFLIGSVAFLFVWGALATLAGLPFLYPFEFTIESGLKGGVGDSGISELVRRLIPAGYTVYWLGVLLPAMATLGTAVLIGGWRTHPQRRVALMLSLWSLGTVAFFSFITGPPFGFPKYFIAALPTMAILGVVAVDAVLERTQARRFGLPLFIAAGVAVAALSGSQSAAVADAGRYSWPGYLWILALLWFGVLAAAAILRDWTIWLPGVAVLGLFMATVAYGLGMATAQASEDASVRYFPGEVGFEETVDRLRGLVEPEDPILVPKDIGSATYNRYHEQEVLFLEPDRLARVLDDEELTYAVVRTDWDYSYLVFPAVESIIEEEMDLVETIGDFLLYKRSDD
ncbi:MAG: ArnT family glycosyltransferase [Acidimicrobiia bacterium]